MPFNLGNHVQETSTVTAGDDYELEGAVSGYLNFAQSGVSNGDLVFYAAFQGGNLEVGIGTYVTGTPNVIQRPVTPGMSTNGGSLVSWGTDTTVNIVCAQPAETIKSLMTRTGTSGWGTQVTGLIARTNVDEYTPYELAGSTNITIQNPRGVGGAPAFDTSVPLADLLRRTGGTATDATMVNELVLSANTTRITGFDGSNEHIIRDATSGEDMVKLVQVGGDPEEMEMWLREGGGTPAWQKGITQGNIGDYLPTVQAASSTTTTPATLTSDSLLSVTIPATGTWAIEYSALVQSQGTSADVQLNAAHATIQEKVGAGGFGDVSYDGWADTRQPLQINQSQRGLTLFYVRTSATNSVEYQYQSVWTNDSNAQLIAGTHRFALKTFRTA